MFITIFGSKWGTEGSHRWLERRRVLVSWLFGLAGVAHNEDVNEIFERLRQDVDEPAFRALVKDGERAALWVICVSIFAGQGGFNYLSGEILAGRLTEQTVVAHFKALRSYFWQKVCRKVVICREAFQTWNDPVYWYDRAIKIGLAAPIVAVLYVLGPTMVVDAEAFWFPPGSVAATDEMTNLERGIVNQLRAARSQEYEGLAAEDNAKLLRDTSRYYELAYRYGSEEQREFASEFVSLAGEIISYSDRGEAPVPYGPPADDSPGRVALNQYQ